jgi:hypothetical protein
MKAHPAIRTSLWLLALSAVILSLWLLGHSQLAAPSLVHPSRWGTWADGRDPVTGALAIVRLLALAVAVYLWLATLLNLAAAASPSTALDALARSVTVPALRRFLGTAAGLGLSATVTLLPGAGALPRSTGPATSGGSGATPAAAANHTATMRQVPSPAIATMRELAPLDQPPGGTATEHELPPEDEGPAGSTSSSTSSSSTVQPSHFGQPSGSASSDHDLRPEAPAADPGSSPSSGARAPAAPSADPTASDQGTAGQAAHPSPAAPAPTSPRAEPWTVGPGENFWVKAASVLARSLGRRPTDAEIVPYWQALIEANRAALADPANPDLIFPGQHFTVPPPS